jgi:hypothetical protein
MPIEYARRWERFDRLLAKDPEYAGEIRKVISALDRAARKCQELLDKRTPTTKRYYRGLHNILAEASHKTEDLIADLRMSLPVYTDFRFTEETDTPASEDHAPKVLQCSPESILIWIPRIPRYNRAYSSLALWELDQLLLHSNIPSLPKWHCDFIHIHPLKANHLGAAFDVDNHPYKPVIDILARALRTDDSAFNFSCGMYNMISDDLKPGCYMHITKIEHNVRFFPVLEKLQK